MERGFCYPKVNISFQIVKRRCWKNFLSYALSLRASHYGAKVLVVDLDQQGNLTRSFNIDLREHPVWLNVIRDNVPIDKAIIPLSETLHILPSNLNNSRLDLELTQSALNLKDVIRDKLAPIRDNYDLVFLIAPPPSIKLICLQHVPRTLLSSPESRALRYGWIGLYSFRNQRIQQEFKISIETKIVWNRYDARERLGAIYMHDLAKDENKIKSVLPVVIRVDASLKILFTKLGLFLIFLNALVSEKTLISLPEMLGLNIWKGKKAA